VSFSAGGRALRDRVAVPVAPPAGCRRRTRAAGHGAARGHPLVADDAATAALVPAVRWAKIDIPQRLCYTTPPSSTHCMLCCGNLWLGS